MSDQYWKCVQLCLIEFHGLDSAKAGALSRKGKSLFAKPKDNYATDDAIVEHVEPFYMACSLTKEKLDISEHVIRYKELLSEAWQKQKTSSSLQGKLKLAHTGQGNKTKSKQITRAAKSGKQLPKLARGGDQLK
jgi:hypothetical protein